MTGIEKLQQIIDDFRAVLDGYITPTDIFHLFKDLIMAAEELYTISKAGSLKKAWVLESWDYINDKYGLVDRIPNWWIRKAINWFDRSILGFAIDGLVGLLKLDKILAH